MLKLRDTCAYDKGPAKIYVYRKFGLRGALGSLFNNLQAS